MPDELPSDPDAVEKWRRLPQNKPSKQALPPATGGARWVWGLLIVVVLMALVLLLAQHGLG